MLNIFCEIEFHFIQQWKQNTCPIPQGWQAGIRRPGMEEKALPLGQKTPRMERGNLTSWLVDVLKSNEIGFQCQDKKKIIFN
jgi:hypothetical protein